MAHEVETPVERVVRFSTTYTSTAWDRPEVSHSTLRFLDADALSAFLRGAGLVIEEQYGDWTGEPLTANEPRDHHCREAGLISGRLPRRLRYDRSRSTCPKES